MEHGNRGQGDSTLQWLGGVTWHLGEGAWYWGRSEGELYMLSCLGDSCCWWFGATPGCEAQRALPAEVGLLVLCPDPVLAFIFLTSPVQGILRSREAMG